MVVRGRHQDLIMRHSGNFRDGRPGRFDEIRPGANQVERDNRRSGLSVIEHEDLGPDRVSDPGHVPGMADNIHPPFRNLRRDVHPGNARLEVRLDRKPSILRPCLAIRDDREHSRDEY